MMLTQDTTEADEQREMIFWRQLPVWRKIEIIGELYEAAENLALADLRRRYPHESQAQLYVRLLERRKLLAHL